jgi:sugar phosphate isomerase/epimerase
MGFEQSSRLSVNEVSTSRWTFEEDCFKYQEQGFGGVGVWRYKLHEYGDEKAGELLQECQLRVSSLQWVGGFTGTHGLSFREAMLDGFEAIEQAVRIQAGCLIVASGSRGSHTKKHSHRLFVDSLRELCEAAAAVQVKISIEPMHVGCGVDWTFLHEMGQALDLIQNLAQPNLGIVLDTYHMAHESKLIHWLPSLRETLHLVQLGDAKQAPMGEANRCLMGHGVLPLRRIVDELECSGYDGFYEIELQGEEIEHLGYEDILEQSRNTMHAWLA